jgi:hypothetical protein
MKKRDAKASRRAILRGAGGVALGLPWLELTSRRAHAQATPPRRFLLISAGHSVDVTRNVDSWLPPAADLSRLSPILEGLAPHKDKVLVLSGIDNVLSDGNVVPSNGHNFSSRSLLTCMPTKPALDAAGNLRAGPPECVEGTPAGGPSFEYFLANTWQSEVLNLRVGERNAGHARSFRMDGTLDEGISSPLMAFDRLFRGRVSTAGAGAAAATGTPEERLRSKRKSILDAVKGNFDSTLSKMGTEDRQRLQQHADHIRQFETGLTRVAQVMCDNPRAPGTAGLPANFEQPEGRYDDVIANAQAELVATAFSCNAARVAHIHFTNVGDNTFPWLNGGRDFIGSGWHNVVHIDQGTDDQRLRPMRWYMQWFGELLGRLAATPEAGGSVLDNTLVMWTSSLRQNWHGTTDLPIVLAGLKGKLRGGRHVRYTPTRTTGDLFTTILNTFDIPATSFGWNKGTAGGRRFINGPLASWA